MTRFLVVSLTVVIAAVEISSVSCFSARLLRPWDLQLVKTSTSLVRRQQRRRRSWQGSALQTSASMSSSAPNNKDSDDHVTRETSSIETEKVETMFLQKNDNDTVLPIPISQPKNIVHTTSDNAIIKTDDQPTVHSSLRLLFLMTRPFSYVGVVLFHVLGVYLALQSPHVGDDAQLLSTLTHPSMFIVLLCLLLTSATSMVINDYFDYQMGVDSHQIDKPLVQGTIPSKVAKRFLYYLYTALLLCLPFVPGADARMSVVVGIMLTYWYTRHLKPITWLKNIVCATLIALSPATSGAAAFYLATQKSFLLSLGVPALWRMNGMMFLGFLGREIQMDINDTADDSEYHVRTVPVTYGRKFAAKVALLCTLAMATVAMMGPIWQIQRAVVGSSSWTWAALSSTLRASPGHATRKLILASIGSLAMVRRAWQVYNTEGEDCEKVDRAVEEGKLSIMFLLASFV